MTPTRQEQLMQYLDGELEEAEAKEMERLLAESAEARALFSDLEEVGSTVRAIGMDRAHAVGDLTDAIMSRVSKEAGPGGGAGDVKSRVVPMARYWAPAAALAMAAAAAWAVYLRPVRTSVPVLPSTVLPTLAVAPTLTPPVAATEEAEEEPGAEIESVDFGARNGTIFMVATGPQVTPVVWLMDENATGGSRMKPL